MKKILFFFLISISSFAQIADSLLVTSTKEIVKVKGATYLKTTTVSHTPFDQSEDFRQVNEYISNLKAEAKEQRRRAKEVSAAVNLYKEAVKKGYKPELNTNEAMFVRELNVSIAKIDSMTTAAKSKPK